jgi:hypothetical protein
MRLRDRRYTPRLDIRIPVQFQLTAIPALPKQKCESTNLSARGVFFITHLVLPPKTPIELFLEMPEEITGRPPVLLCITGQVKRVEPAGVSNLQSGVGVEFLCYEVPRF